MTLRRIEIPGLRLCRIPHCPNEVDPAAPTRGAKAGQCPDCRAGKGFPIRLYRDTLARGSERYSDPLPVEPTRRPRGRGHRKTNVEPTEVEIGVLRAIAAGMSNAEIGTATFRSTETIKSHVQILLAKLEARNRAHLVSVGYQRGLLP